MLQLVLALNILPIQRPKWALAGFRPSYWPIERSIIELVRSAMDEESRAVLDSNLAETDIVQRAFFSTSEVAFFKLGFLSYDQDRQKRWPHTGENVVIRLTVVGSGEPFWVEVISVDGRLFSLRIGTDIRPIRNEQALRLVDSKSEILFGNSEK